MTEFAYLNTSYSEPVHTGDISAWRDLELAGLAHRVGQKLPNGAILLSEVVLRVYPHRRDSLVLAVASGFQPFVSWLRIVQTDVPERNDDGSHNSWYNVKDYCESGDYSSFIEGAVEKFKARVNEKRELFDPKNLGKVVRI